MLLWLVAVSQQQHRNTCRCLFGCLWRNAVQDTKMLLPSLLLLLLVLLLPSLLLQCLFASWVV
jgi:hypothetical protein